MRTREAQGQCMRQPRNTQPERSQQQQQPPPSHLLVDGADVAHRLRVAPLLLQRRFLAHARQLLLPRLRQVRRALRRCRRTRSVRRRARARRRDGRRALVRLVRRRSCLARRRAHAVRAPPLLCHLQPPAQRVEARVLRGRPVRGARGSRLDCGLLLQLAVDRHGRGLAMLRRRQREAWIANKTGIKERGKESSRVSGSGWHRIACWPSSQHLSFSRTDLALGARRDLLSVRRSAMLQQRQPRRVRRCHRATDRLEKRRRHAARGGRIARPRPLAR